MYKGGTDYLAYRVRRFSAVVMVMSPLIAIYHFTIYIVGGAVNSFDLGFAIGMFVWGATFIYPRKLAHYRNTNKQKNAAFCLFCLALFSALIWFPLNAGITKT